MNNPKRETLLQKTALYGRRAGVLSRQVRQRVFGFRLPSTLLTTDSWALPVKLDDHRLKQRQRTFQQSGGPSSGIAVYGLNKARHKQL